MRILYTDLYMGKRYVRLNTGRSFEAYLVDEDQRTYTFRKNINKPDEFEIARDSVLFMSRSNPTGLRSTPDTTSIRLDWYPPYRKPDKYRVYMKIKPWEKYKRIATVRGTSHRVLGLKKKTRYYFRITAVDKEGAESVPSNEIRTKTNTPPGPPELTQADQARSTGGGETMDFTFSWKPARDKDGTVREYAVYQEVNKEEKKIGTTRVTTYTVKDLDTDKIHRFAIRSVDNDGDESVELIVSTKMPLRFRLSVQPLYAYPLRDFRAIARHGYGGTVRLDMVNLFAEGLTLKFGIGCIYFMGTGDMDREYMVPGFLSLGYNFKISESFYVAPFVAGGGSYNIIYRLSEKIPLTLNADLSIRNLPIKGSEQKRGFTPLAAGGLEFTFIIKRGFFMNLKTEYWAILEKDALFDFVSAAVGFGYRF